MKIIKNFFAKETENDSLVGMTESIMDRSEQIMKKTLMPAMQFDNLKDMSSEDIEFMRETSALWCDSKEYAMKAAERLDQVDELRKKVEDLVRKVDYQNDLLRDIRSKLREIAERRDA